MKGKGAIKLFLDKEGRQLKGKKKFNFWVLTTIFFVAIMSIGFGSASMEYLQYKMEDPFINWVDIIARQRVSDKSKKPLEEFLNDSTMQSLLHFSQPEDNYVLNIDFRHQVKNKNVQMQGRSIDAQSSILPKIMDGSNVLVDRELPLSNRELGLIVTQAALKELGYDEIPAFIELSLSYDSTSCNELGILGAVNGSYPVVFPIKAVVKQLPGMVSFLFTNRFLYDYSASNETSWDITDDEYNQALYLVGEDEELHVIKTSIENMGYIVSQEPYRNSWDRELCCLMVEGNPYEDESAKRLTELANQYVNTDKGIYRVYNFQPITSYQTDRPTYLSVQIQNLESIRLFQAELYDQCGIKLEMSSIDQKSNFQFVQRMGRILSLCIIGIAVLFICFFIYFMLNTHFQRIEGNLGTFKAFGIQNKMLYYIYINLLVRITLGAFLLAMGVSFVGTTILNIFYTIESGYHYIDVLVWQNGVLFVLALCASTTASWLVAKNKLRHTPGDLIYKRNLDK